MSTSNAMRTYREHNCTRAHRSYKAWAKCTWPTACTTGAGVWGEGPYAFVAYCGRKVEVRLYADLENAVRHYETMERSSCGYGCTASKHRLIRIVP